MDDEQKKAAREAADTKLADAKTAETAAKAELDTAKKANDEAKVKAAETKVTKAGEDVAAAQAEVDALAGDDVQDIIDDANQKPPLRDGTPADKPITVAKDKFDDLNEKAKLFEQFGPVLSKLKENPDLIERLMAGDDPSKPLADRIKALESRADQDKRDEINTTIKSAAKKWPDFTKRWNDIKPILNGILASGVSYPVALQRAYFAVNPDAAKQNARLVAEEASRNSKGSRDKMDMGGGGGHGPIIGDEPEDDQYQMNDSDREFANKAGVDPKLYQKHAGWIDRFRDL